MGRGIEPSGIGVTLAVGAGGIWVEPGSGTGVGMAGKVSGIVPSGSGVALAAALAAGVEALAGRSDGAG
jgi:hypothetical protein